MSISIFHTELAYTSIGFWCVVLAPFLLNCFEKSERNSEQKARVKFTEILSVCCREHFHFAVTKAAVSQPKSTLPDTHNTQPKQAVRTRPDSSDRSNHSSARWGIPLCGVIHTVPRHPMRLPDAGPQGHVPLTLTVPGKGARDPHGCNRGAPAWLPWTAEMFRAHKERQCRAGQNCPSHTCD